MRAAAAVAAEHDTSATDTEPTTHDTSKPHTPKFVWTFRLVLYAALAGAIALGSPVTRAAAVAALFFAILADHDGLIRHLCKVAGLGVAIWQAPLLGWPTGAWLAARSGMSLLTTQCGATLVAGLIIVFLGGQVGRILSVAPSRHAFSHGVNKVLGGLLGCGEGVLLVAAVCWTLAAFATSPAQALGQSSAAVSLVDENQAASLVNSLNASIQADPTGELLLQYNPLPEIDVFKTMQDAAAVTASPENLEAFIEGDTMREFCALPVVKKHIDAFQTDPELRTAVQRRDIAAIMQSEQFRAMLEDAELHQTVMDRWDELTAAMTEVDSGESN